MHKIKLDNGKYKYVESYKGLDGKRHRVSVTKSNQTRLTEKQAFEELQEKIKEKLKKNSNKSLNFYIEEFIEFKRHTVAKKTLRQIENYLGKIASDTLIYNLNKNDLEKTLNDFRAKYHHKTIKSITVAVNTLFKYIHEYHDPNFNMNLKFRFTKEDKVKDKLQVKHIETSKLDEVLSGIENELVRDFATVQLHTGLRIGELLALTKEDVDLENKLLKVNKTRLADGSYGPPKTVSSIRTIEFSDLVGEILAKHFSSSELIFDVGKNYINYYLRLTNLKSHMFRHTHVALLVEAGVPIKVISERLGHSDTSTTLDIYTHITQTMKIDLQEKLEKLGTF